MLLKRFQHLAFMKVTGRFSIFQSQLWAVSIFFINATEIIHAFNGQRFCSLEWLSKSLACVYSKPLIAD